MDTTAHISSQCPWKISDSSRIQPSANSFTLANKFSPSRSKDFRSRLLSQYVCMYVNQELTALFMLSQQQASRSKSKAKQISGIKQESSISGMPRLAKVQTSLLKGVAASGSFSQFLSKGSMQSVLSSGTANGAKLITEMRRQFEQFKKQVWAELKQQREVVKKIGQDIMKKLEEVSNNVNSRAPLSVTQQQLETLIAAPTTAQIKKDINLIENKMIKIQEIQTPIKPLKLSQPSASPPKPIISFPKPTISTPIASQHPKTITENTPVQPIKSKNQRLSLKNEKSKLELVSQRSRLELVSGLSNKCEQLAQTIGILHQINSTLVTNKASEQCKQIMEKRGIGSQIKQLSSPKGSAASQVLLGQSKSNGKLDKFYSAIQKLKEEVNQIRSKSSINPNIVIKTYQQ